MSLVISPGDEVDTEGSHEDRDSGSPEGARPCTRGPCSGLGRLWPPEDVFLAALRELPNLVFSGQWTPVRVTVSVTWVVWTGSQAPGWTWDF